MNKLKPITKYWRLVGMQNERVYFIGYHFYIIVYIEMSVYIKKYGNNYCNIHPDIMLYTACSNPPINDYCVKCFDSNSKVEMKRNNDWDHPCYQCGTKKCVNCFKCNATIAKQHKELCDKRQSIQLELDEMDDKRCQLLAKKKELTDMISSL